MAWLCLSATNSLLQCRPCIRPYPPRPFPSSWARRGHVTLAPQTQIYYWYRQQLRFACDVFYTTHVTPRPAPHYILEKPHHFSTDWTDNIPLILSTNSATSQDCLDCSDWFVLCKSCNKLGNTAEILTVGLGSPKKNLTRL